MKQLQKSDLKEGEIYKQLIYNYIFLYNKNETSNSFNDGTAISTTALRYYKRWSGNRFEKPMVEATLEEKHWLKVCIEADKFVSYEEAMKTFVPEYYEYIGETNLYNTEFIKGKTYKIVNKNNLEAVYNFINEKGIANGWSGTNWKYFKPSTKEAYDAQFVVKEKENTTVTEKPKIVFEKPKDKVLQLNQIRGKGTTIVQVQCSEGGVYKIGDKITVFDKISPNKGKSFTIQGFRWNNAKTKLCAITELHTPNGIGLDKIELYFEPKVEPKQELSLLEQAKLRYPVGTKIISPTSNSLFTIKGNIRYGFPGSCVENYIFGNDGECSLYLPYKNKWAEIVDDFVLPEKWCVRLTGENQKIVIDYINKNTKDSVRSGNIGLYYGYNGEHCTCIHSLAYNNEITFEQFKKYVLKDE